MSDLDEYGHSASDDDRLAGPDGDYDEENESSVSRRTRSRPTRSSRRVSERLLASEVMDDAPTTASSSSSRRRSARLRSQEPKPPTRILVIDDEDGDYEDNPEELVDELLSEDELPDEDVDEDEEELSDEEAYGRKRKARQAVRKPPRKRVANTLPLALVPEDVPWKELNPQPDADPEDLEYSPSVAFLAIFMNTFPDAFEGLPPMGPQDIEEGVVNNPSPAIEQLFLRLLGLVLNRKKEIEPGRYTSALGELHALLPVLGVPPRMPEIPWKSKTAFEELQWEDRLDFLHVLAQWALVSSQRISYLLGYLTEDAIYPWIGQDNKGNKYYLVQGNGDTLFRLYRETNRLLSTVSWKPVASAPEEVERLVTTLLSEGGASKKLAEYLEEVLPSLRETEDRRIKEMRRQRRRQDLGIHADLVRQGEGSYSGRTRGKRVDYSLLAYEREIDQAISTRRSARQAAREAARPASPPPDKGIRHSRRLRGEAPIDLDAPSYIELRAAQEAEEAAIKQQELEEEQRRLEEKARQEAEEIAKKEQEEQEAAAKAEEKRRIARERARARAAVKAEAKRTEAEQRAAEQLVAQSQQTSLPPQQKQTYFEPRSGFMPPHMHPGQPGLPSQHGVPPGLPGQPVPPGQFGQLPGQVPGGQAPWSQPPNYSYGANVQQGYQPRPQQPWQQDFNGYGSTSDSTVSAPANITHTVNNGETPVVPHVSASAPPMGSAPTYSQESSTQVSPGPPSTQLAAPPPSQEGHPPRPILQRDFPNQNQPGNQAFASHPPQQPMAQQPVHSAPKIHRPPALADLLQPEPAPPIAHTQRPDIQSQQPPAQPPVQMDEAHKPAPTSQPTNGQ